MTLEFINDSWDGIECGEVEFRNEYNETIIARYEVNAEYYNQLWKEKVDDDYLWESEGANNSLIIDDVEYDNLWCYIILNETPTFYNEDKEEIIIEEYTIECV